MKKVDLKELKKAAKEMVKVMGIEPELGDEATQETSDKWMKKAIGYIDPKTDEFSQATQDIIDVYSGKASEEDVEEETSEKEPEDEQKDNERINELLDEVETADRLKNLKDIVTANEEFKSIRGKLASYKEYKDLQNAMLDLLMDGAPKADDAKEEAKEEKEDTKKKADPKKKEPEKTSTEEKQFPTHEGSIAQFMDSILKEGGTWEELSEALKTEVERRGVAAPTSAGALRAHLKYRMSKDAKFLGKLKSTDEGIK